jgi:hypothetical protein
VTDMDHIGHIEDCVYLEDHEFLVLRGRWWTLDTDDSAIERLRPQLIGQALIGRGSASCEGVQIEIRTSEVVDGPFILAMAMDADFGNELSIATASDYVELARLYGEVLEGVFFCGHDYTFSGTGAMVLP